MLDETEFSFKRDDRILNRNLMNLEKRNLQLLMTNTNMAHTNLIKNFKMSILILCLMILIINNQNNLKTVQAALLKRPFSSSFRCLSICRRDEESLCKRCLFREPMRFGKRSTSSSGSPSSSSSAASSLASSASIRSSSASVFREPMRFGKKRGEFREMMRFGRQFQQLHDSKLQDNDDFDLNSQKFKQLNYKQLQQIKRIQEQLPSIEYFDNFGEDQLAQEQDQQTKLNQHQQQAQVDADQSLPNSLRWNQPNLIDTINDDLANEQQERAKQVSVDNLESQQQQPHPQSQQQQQPQSS